jgi:hypothetical protein
MLPILADRGTTTARTKSSLRPECAIDWITIAVLVVTLAGFFARESRAETNNETFLSFVDREIARVCVLSPIADCENDFEISRLVAKSLDTEEERAIVLEKSGDDTAAKELRFEILQYAALLDIHLEELRARHRPK